MFLLWLFSWKFYRFSFHVRSGCYSWSVFSSNYFLRGWFFVWVSCLSVLFFCVCWWFLVSPPVGTQIPVSAGGCWLGFQSRWGEAVGLGLGGWALLACVLRSGWDFDGFFMCFSSPHFHTHMFHGTKSKVSGHKQGTAGAPVPVGLSAIVWVSFPLSLSFFFPFYVRHMEVARLGVASELQLPAYTSATALPDPECTCSLHCSLWQYQLPNPLSEARNQPSILMGTWFLTCQAAAGTLGVFIVPCFLWLWVCQAPRSFLLPGWSLLHILHGFSSLSLLDGFLFLCFL